MYIQREAFIWNSSALSYAKVTPVCFGGRKHETLTQRKWFNWKIKDGKLAWTNNLKKFKVFLRVRNLAISVHLVFETTEITTHFSWSQFTLESSYNKTLSCAPQGSGDVEIQVNIGTVVYLHHGLMSKEHVLASNMSQHYDEYIQKRQKNYVNFYLDKLAALRRAVATLRTASDDMFAPDGNYSAAWGLPGLKDAVCSCYSVFEPSWLIV